MFILFISIMFHFKVMAVSIEFYGPCDAKAFYQKTFKFTSPSSVGDATIAILDMAKIPYLGTKEGIVSINQSAHGMEALEIVNDQEMRSYGWCYALNDQSPDELAHLVKIENDNDRITWWYGYATFKNGEWSDYCQPAYKIKPTLFCQ